MRFVVNKIASSELAQSLRVRHRGCGLKKNNLKMFIVRLLSWSNGSKANQYIFAVILSLPLFCFGMIQGWLSPMRKTLQSHDGPSNQPYTLEQISWAASVTYITAILLGIPLGYFVDKFGRKIMSLITIASLILYWAVKIISLEPESLILARAIAGFPCSACYIICPVYIKEISDKDLRSSLGSLIVLVRNVGYLTSFILADVLSWTWMLYAGISAPIIVFLLFLLLPETPEFLVQQGKIEEAKEVMAWLRGTTMYDSRLIQDLDLLVYQEKQSNAESPWSTIFYDSTTRKAFILTIFIKVAQQFDGYLIVLLYASYIFEIASETVDMKLTPNTQVILVGTVQLIGSMLATLLVERTGTKLLLVVTSGLVGVGMLILGSWFYLSLTDVYVPGWIPVVAMCLAIFSDAAGFQPISYLIISDMFSFHLRGQVSAATNVLAKVANFVQSKFFHDLNQMIGIQWTFMGFAVVCFFTSLVSIFWFPETRGRTLDEIYRDLSGRDKKEQKGTP